MNTRIIVTGICLVVLVGCSNGETSLPVTPTSEETADTTINSQTATPAATPTDETRAQMIIPDMKALHQGTVWKGYISSANLVEKDGKPAIEINKEDYNVIWLDGFEFTNGMIEFDAKGKSEPPQSSFIGVSFRVVDDVTYDSIYFRPFNFRATDPGRKSHAVQYQSFPDWDWYKLRTEKPGQYEKPIDPAPDGDMWFHVKITINERQIKVFVDNATEPSLEVTELSDRSGGSVGIYCFGYGVIANFEITPAQ